MYYNRRRKGIRYRAQEPGQKKARNDDSDPFAIPNLLEALNCSRFGSMAEDIKDLLDRRSRASNSFFRMHSIGLDVEKKPIKEETQLKQLETPLALPDVIVLDDDNVADHVVTTRSEVVLIDSDVEETGDQRPFNPYWEPAAEFLMNDKVYFSAFVSCNIFNFLIVIA